MIPKDCKRLAEVDFPIATVSRHAAREKSIRHGHPSTLHLWWARRPLAACRSMLLALLLPDPCDPLCPEEFGKAVRSILPPVQGRVGQEDAEVRQALLDFIGDFANWDKSSEPKYLEAGRALVKAAHPEETPLVVDPFAGGGSIPLEALRLGCEAFASDLNPVACLILKVMLEDIPRHGPGLAEELREAGRRIRGQTEKELRDLYPEDPDKSKPIAYLWARTVTCESPNCGAEIPLVRSFWLCKKANRRRALGLKVMRPKGAAPRVEFQVFEPGSEKDVPPGTVSRAKATCPACKAVLPPERVRAQLAAQRGGADVIFDAGGKRIGGARLLVVVTLKPGAQGRHYRLATDRDYAAVWESQKRLQSVLRAWEAGGKKGLCPVPDEPTPAGGGSGAGRAFSVQRYGMLQWGDLFTARQKLALHRIASGGPKSGAVADAHALVAGRCADYLSANASWAQSGEFIRSTFGRQALPIVWDFAETAPFSSASGNYQGAVDWSTGVLGATNFGTVAEVKLGDARCALLPGESATVWFTDPPYYDAVPYADLSDFFFVWLKRALPGHALLKDPFDPSNPLTPKAAEIIEDQVSLGSDGNPKDRAFYEDSMARAFAAGRSVLREDGVASVVFAHKTTEGWEALLSGMIRGGWTITGSWPIATERPGRLRSQESAALATSVHLVCRPRAEEAGVGDWSEVLRELPERVGAWMERLQSEGVRGADLVFACIGPALEIYSRYAKVETAEGREVALAEYLSKVWEVVGRAALEQVLGTGSHSGADAAAGALEEDARLTALFLWTLQSTNGGRRAPAAGAEEEEGGAEEDVDDEEEAPRPKPRGGFTLVFDVVRRFAQPLGIELPKWEGRIIETEKGAVRLLALRERAKVLFGKEEASTVAEWIQADPSRGVQLVLFPESEAPSRLRSRREIAIDASSIEQGAMPEATTLDRVHVAMLLQAGGQTTALKSMIGAELDRGPDFLRLANALSALYPAGSEEKRLLDAMLLAVPR